MLLLRDAIPQNDDCTLFWRKFIIVLNELIQRLDVDEASEKTHTSEALCFCFFHFKLATISAGILMNSIMI